MKSHSQTAFEVRRREPPTALKWAERIAEPCSSRYDDWTILATFMKEADLGLFSSFPMLRVCSVIHLASTLACYKPLVEGPAPRAVEPSYPEFWSDRETVRLWNGVIPCGSEEQKAARRFFTNANLIGLSHRQVFLLLGVPKNGDLLSDRWRYLFDDGLGGVGYELVFEDDIVHGVQPVLLE